MKDLATKNTKDTKKVWPTVRLGDVCEVRAGATHHEIVSDTGKYPVYGSGGYICQATTYRCPANTVTIGRKGTLDKPLLIEEPFWNIDTCFGVIPNEALDAKYLWRFCQNFDFYKLIPAIGRPSTNSDAIKSITIPLPPLTVQREIVARLEKELGEADKLAAKFKRVAELADNAFKAELDETFKAAEDNSRRDAEARRVRLGDVCEFVRNGANIKQRKGAAGIPITRIETLSGGVFNSQKVGYADIMNEEPFEKHIVGIGDLLISHINSAQFVGRTVMYRGEINGPIIHGMNLLRARLLDSGKILPAYVELWFKTISARIYISGVTKKSVNQASVNTTDFKRMPIIRPPISTQRAIIAKLNAAKGRCEKLKAAAMRGLAAAENLRKAILAEAFEQ